MFIFLCIFFSRCPIEPTLTTYPLSDLQYGLRFQMFRFVGNYSYVYMHCKCLVCGLNEKQSKCDQTCNVRRRRDASEYSGVYEESYEEILLQNGPFRLVDPSPLVGGTDDTIEEQAQNDDTPKDYKGQLYSSGIL